MFAEGQKVIRIVPTTCKVKQGQVYTVARQGAHGELYLKGHDEGFYDAATFAPYQEKEIVSPRWDIPNWVLAIIVIVGMLLSFVA